MVTLNLTQFRFMDASDSMVLAVGEHFAYALEMERLSRSEGSSTLADSAFRAQEAILAAITALDDFYREDARAAEESGAYS